MFQRLLAQKISSSRKSILLLGPRQTGKSTLIRSLKPDLTINLAREQTFLEFSSDPALLEKTLEQERPKTVFIDEVQRLPSMLNTIQTILDEQPGRHRFFLTGSSARKLKRGHANLLPGRIITHRLGPILSEEAGNEMSLDDCLAYGTLPGILSEPNVKERLAVLRSYASTYLKEEIQAEALTKNIEGFSRFLMVAASKSGEFLDFAKLGSLASISQKTSTRFFEILEDTLIVHRLDAYAANVTRRLVRHPKYYFFDNGVLNGLLGSFAISADRRGFAFEHFIVNQIITANATRGEPARLSTYRTEAGSEVDLVIERGDEVLSLEIKSARTLSSGDFAGLRSFAEFHGPKKLRSVLLYAGDRAYKEGAVSVLPWRPGLAELVGFLE